MQRAFSSLRRSVQTRQVRSLGSAVHSAAVEGFGSQNLQRYERGRPGYPESALDAIIAVLGTRKTQSASALVELGAGTGKFTSAFAPLLARQQEQCKYVATEPVDAMREALEEKCRGIPSVVTAAGSGSSIPLENGTAQGVCVAQAFHWMASTDTLQEVHRVLAPGGHLFMIWNTFDYSIPWIHELEHNIIGPNYEPGVPRQQNMLWKEVFKTQLAKDLFTPLEFFECRQAQVGPFELIADRVLSISVIAKQSEEHRAKVRDQLRELLATHPDTRHSNTYSLEYCTHLYWCASKPT